MPCDVTNQQHIISPTDDSRMSSIDHVVNCCFSHIQAIVEIASRHELSCDDS